MDLASLTGGITAGFYRFEALFDSVISVYGSSYKIVKSIIMKTCPGILRRLQQPKHQISITPLLEAPRKPIIEAHNGWKTNNITPTEKLLPPDAYSFQITWAGNEETTRLLQELASCLLEKNQTKLANPATQVGISLLEAGIEHVYPIPADEVEITLITPAQITFRASNGKTLVLACPPPSKLLQHPLELLSSGNQQLQEQLSILLDANTGITASSLKPVTLVLDKKKNTTWTITGKARITLSLKAKNNNTISKLLGTTGILAAYTGIGKSRLTGLGAATTQIKGTTPRPE